MGPSNINFISFGVMFHFHDYERKGTLWKTNIAMEYPHV